jgi:hypothetical protein
MEDERYHCNHDQKVNKASSDVKRGPRNQPDNEQNEEQTEKKEIGKQAQGTSPLTNRLS